MVPVNNGKLWFREQQKSSARPFISHLGAKATFSKVIATIIIKMLHGNTQDEPGVTASFILVFKLECCLSGYKKLTALWCFTWGHRCKKQNHSVRGLRSGTRVPNSPVVTLPKDSVLPSSPLMHEDGEGLKFVKSSFL